MYQGDVTLISKYLLPASLSSLYLSQTCSATNEIHCCLDKQITVI